MKNYKIKTKVVDFYNNEDDKNILGFINNYNLNFQKLTKFMYLVLKEEILKELTIKDYVSKFLTDLEQYYTKGTTHGNL